MLGKGIAEPLRSLDFDKLVVQRQQTVSFLLQRLQRPELKKCQITRVA